jgi:hypothetical protein
MLLLRQQQSLQLLLRPLLQLPGGQSAGWG